MKLSSFLEHRKLTQLDKTSTSAVVLAIKKANDQGNYESFKHYINNSPLDIIVEIAYKCPDNRLIQRYVNEFPKSADAHFLYAIHLVDKAWQSSHKSTRTTDLRFLSAAHIEVCKVLRLNPNYLPAFSLLIKIQRGKNNKKLAYIIYQQAKKTAPYLADYHIQQMTLLTPKWGGSSKEMFSFAKECSQKDPTGILHCLIPVVHFEYWNSLSKHRAERYINNKRVKREIQQAYLEVENAEFGTGYYKEHQYYLALNYFSLLFLLMGDKDKAKTIFNRIEGKYTYRPWVNMGENPGVAYLKYKKLAQYTL